VEALPDTNRFSIAFSRPVVVSLTHCPSPEMLPVWLFRLCYPLLNNCARRDAIPAVVLDLRREWAGAWRKIWQLIENQENARALRELNEIDQELTAASETMSPKHQSGSSSPLRMLWDIFAAAGGGAATATLSGGNAKIGALTKALPQVIGSAADAMNFFRRGAFDLAGRVRSAASAVGPVPDLYLAFLPIRRSKRSDTPAKNRAIAECKWQN
jgi:hypothetical protein